VGVQRVLEPTQVVVRVDSLVRESKRVRFQGEYATSPGLSLVRPPVLVPDQVMISGPKSRVEEVAAVNTVSVDLRLLTESVSREVPLELGEAYNVKAEPATVRLELDVAPTVRRDVAGVPVQVPAGWSAEPSEVTLGVAGAEARLAGLGAEYYRAAVTLPDRAVSDSFYTVHATVPPLVEILSIHPDRVRIRRP
jgi:YbbR domain-containing protein